MPPQKRKRPFKDVTSPASNADRSVPTDSPSQSHHSAGTSYITDDDSDPPPFLNTTFTTYRVSPLYVGSHPLTQGRIHALSLRLRDMLVGDVVRGLEVGLDRGADDAAMRRAGALESLALGWVRLEDLVGRYVGHEGEVEDGGAEDGAEDASGLSAGEGASPGKKRALQISLQYENTECAALLLPSIKSQARPEDAGATSPDPDFINLPMLLLRMPAPLKIVIIDFLSRTFDCRISPLSLGTRSLVRALERWMADSGMPTKGPFAKEVVLTLGFHGPMVTRAQQRQTKAGEEKQLDDDEADGPKVPDSSVGLKSIDVIISNTDLRRFIRAGRRYEAERDDALIQARDKRNNTAAPGTSDVFSPIKRRKLGGDKDEEGWTWRRSKPPSKSSDASQDTLGRPQPFTEALSQYVRKHLALDMFHPAVRITKVACGGFALSEGRVKIFGTAPSKGDGALSDTQQRAVWSLLDGLLERAEVKPLDRILGGISV